MKYIIFAVLLGIAAPAHGINAIDRYNEVNELWKITYYCSCEKCCGKWADGHFASGKKCYAGGVACNWLPFGTKVLIGNKEYTVEDRGAKSLFGDNDNHIKHIDIWMASHAEALKAGVKYKKVKILK